MHHHSDVPGLVRAVPHPVVPLCSSLGPQSIDAVIVVRQLFGLQVAVRAAVILDIHLHPLQSDSKPVRALQT
jgi:hypothetical protein